MNSKAFSITELTIVLTIIGVIMGSFIAGYSLSYAAKNRQIVGEWQYYQSAIDNFYAIYKTVPGDMYNATSFFSSTVNGNGDRLVNYVNNATPGYTSYTYEEYTIWNHLQLAGFIKGSYSNTTYSSAYSGNNYLPLSQVNKMRWNYLMAGSNFYNIIGAFTANLLIYSAGCCGWLGNGISPINAYQIDKKYDDANATSGKIFAFTAGGTGTCVRTNNGTGSNVSNTYVGGSNPNYNLTESTLQCALGFVTVTR